MHPTGVDDAESRRLWRSLLSSVRKRGVDSHTAEDIVQETWLRMLRRPPKERGRTSGWLHVVALRLVSEIRRRSSREAPLGMETSHLGSGPTAVEGESRLLRWVAELPSPYGEVIRLRYVEEREIHEIAALLGRSPTTVRSQIKRGLDQLRVRVGPPPRARLGALLAFALGRRARRASARPRRASASAWRWVGGVALVLGLVAWRLASERASLSSAVPIAAAPHAARASAELDEWELADPGSSAGRRLDAATEPSRTRLHLFGRVVAPDGAPVAGASVLVGVHDQRRRVAVTDGDGRYSADELDPELCIWAACDPWWDSNHCYVASAHADAGLELRLNEVEGRREVRILSSTDRPLAGARVVVESELPGRAVSYLTPRGTLEKVPITKSFVTDESGRAALVWLRGSVPSITITAPGEVAWNGPLEHASDASIAEIRMPAPAVVEGWIHDAAGRPAPGASIEVLQHKARLRLSATSDASGSFRVSGLGPGPFLLRAAEEPTRGSASARLEGVVSAGATLELEAELGPRATVRGRALFHGRPVAGARVRLNYQPSESEEAGRYAEVASDGGFSFPGCPERARGKLMLVAPGEDEPCLVQPLVATLDAADEQRLDADVDLAATAPLRLVLERDAGVRPADTVLVTRQPSGFSRVLRPELASALFRSGPLPAGDYDVSAWIADWGRWRVGRIHHDPSAPVVHRLALASPSTLRIRLDLPPGVEPEGFDVSVVAETFDKSALGLQNDDLLRRLPFDAEQDAFTGKIQSGEYTVQVRRSGFAELDARVELDAGEGIDTVLAPERGVEVVLDLELQRPLASREGLTLELRSQAGSSGRRVSWPARRRAFQVPLSVPSSTLEIGLTSDRGLHGSLTLQPGWSASARDSQLHLALVLAEPEPGGALLDVREQ